MIWIVKSKIESIRKQIQEREQALGNARESLDTGREYLEEGERNLERNKDMHKKTVAGLTTRRKELIADMFSIYPIDQVSTGTSGPSTTKSVTKLIAGRSF